MVFKALLVLLSIALFGLAQEYAPDVALDHPAIKYFENPVNDVVSKLAKDVESGKVSLEHRGGLSWLPSVLQRLGINTDSQALVFSRTSVQAAKVAPNHPRAIYFADNVAVAFVPGSDEIELAATDPRQGVVFYSLNIKPAEKPAFVRGTFTPVMAFSTQSAWRRRSCRNSARRSISPPHGDARTRRPCGGADIPGSAGIRPPSPAGRRNGYAPRC